MTLRTIMRHLTPPVLGWSDYLTIDIEGKEIRRTLKDWYSSDPCAVVTMKRQHGPFLKYNVYYFFMTKVHGCED
jgi:hypothetical protein